MPGQDQLKWRLSLAEFALGLQHAPQDRAKIIWRLLAFLGRYGHQPLVHMLDMTVQDLSTFADAIASIMNEESLQTQMRTDID